MTLLTDKAVIVTGAGGGIGRAVALDLAKRGASLVLSDLGCDAEGHGSDPTVVEDVAQHVRDVGGRTVSHHDDLGTPLAVAALCEGAADAFGRIDVVIACHGIERVRSLKGFEHEDFEQMVATHLGSAFSLLASAAPHMTDGGAFVFCSGTHSGAARQSLSASCNAGLSGLVRTAAVELRRQNIRVNAVAPTARTRLTEESATFRGIGKDSMTAAHVTPLIAFLASDLSQDVTGEVLGVAGGRVYAFQHRETTGAYTNGEPFTPEAIQARWREIVRG